MLVTLPDGYRLFVEEAGAGFPLVVLHGGPGMDHTMFRPWLDPLGDEFRLLYVDERGQGRSDRVDPATLSLEVFARDVDLLADALALDRYALLGHSFGAIVTTWHATSLGTAAAYVISGGAESSDALMADVHASFETLGDRRAAIEASWEAGEDRRHRRRGGAAARRTRPRSTFTASLRRASSLRRVTRRTSCAISRTPATAISTTATRSAALRARRSSWSEITISPRRRVPRVCSTTASPAASSWSSRMRGHMSFVEEQDAYLTAVRDFLRRKTSTK